MKTLKLLTLIGITACSSISFAQQLPQFTQYMFNTISVNPAYAGSRETLNVTALHRNQWTGIDGNPRTSTLSIHAPLRNDRIGLGMSYINDRLGFESTNYVYGDFSYTVPVSMAASLSFGLKAGFTNYRLETPDPTPRRGSRVPRRDRTAVRRTLRAQRPRSRPSRCRRRRPRGLRRRRCAGATAPQRSCAVRRSGAARRSARSR